MESDRRRFLAYFTSVGLGSSLFPGVLWAKLQETGSRTVSSEALREAARLAGIDFTEAEEAELLESVNKNLLRREEIRRVPLDNFSPIPLVFSPRVPAITLDRTKRPLRMSDVSALERPENLEELAFWPVTHLAHLVRSREVRSVELTEMYLARIERYDPMIHCVVTVTRDLALEQAERADAEIEAGRYRGPLHGIPWGAKDIISVRGYPTTWGAEPFRDQVIDSDATVVERLNEAGAVLVAKLTTGELAFGDRWFGGRTHNPWNLDEGSSGSSAGSGAATSAGLVGFAIGTDTGGSILSPSARCGIVGLRPTFGRVSRHGVMSAGFTLDKIGPMCRTVEDCALVLHAIQGADGKDFSVLDVPFNWDATLDPKTLELGYYPIERDSELDPEVLESYESSLETLRTMGFDPRPVTLPKSDLNFFIEFVERAAAFQELVLTRGDEKLGRSQHGAELRAYSLVPAVDYLQANRVRRELMEETARAIAGVDAVVAPRTSADPSLSTNPLSSMTGHPVVAVPSGLTPLGTPAGVTFMGRLFQEEELLSIAKAYEEAVGFAGTHPRLEG